MLLLPVSTRCGLAYEFVSNAAERAGSERPKGEPRGFFGDEEIARLRQPHASRTVDLSLISRALEPFWESCARLVPPSVAPNAITLSGLFLVAVSFVVVLVVDPSLAGPVPAAAHLLSIGAIFAFQTLDALDGKQARKTKSSSALGNWCDHACDVVAVQMAMTGAAGALGLGTGGALLFLLASVATNNYVIHWETQHTNTLYMGNGTSIYEAQLMMMAVHAVSLVFGVEPWSRALADVLPAASALPWSGEAVRLWFVVVGVGAIGGVGVVGSVVRVARAGKGRAALLELVLPALLCASSAIVVLRVSGGDAVKAPFVFATALIGLHLIARQILSQLVGTRIKLLQVSLVPLVATALLLLAVPESRSSRVAAALGWGNLAFALSVCASTYLGATFAIARALGLPILTLPKRTGT